MFIKLSNVSKSYQTEPLFTEVSLTIGSKDKIGVIGRNGTGKSTLLKLISEKTSLDSGTIQIESIYQPLYFTQQLESIDETLTIEEYLFKQKGLLNLKQRFQKFEKGNSSDLEILSEYEDNGCYQFENSINKILNDLKLEYLDSKSQLEILSGGEKTRLRLAPLIFEKFEILLLDEPTNNLDVTSINWLEHFLQKFEGVIVMVSHDRQFLDNVTNRIIEIEEQQVSEYFGNFSEYKVQKSSQIKNIENKFEAQNKHIQKIQKQINSKISSADHLDRNFTSADPYIMSMSGKKAKQAQILKRKLEKKIEDQDLHVPQKNWEMDFQFSPKIKSSNNVLELKNVSKSFGENLLFTGLNLKINRADRVLVRGKNGSGKSTLLKIIARETEADIKSKIIYGKDLITGYFNQEDSFKSCENTVISEFMNFWEDSEGEARTFLHKMLFKADDVFIKVSSLSPGERAKFKLATILAQTPNLLILDEPTNNLDIASREQLEKALDEYSGTLIVVSHDRYFIEKLEFNKFISL